MHRPVLRGGDSRSSSESSSASGFLQIPVDSNSSGPTPEEELQSYKRLLPKSALYFFTDEEFLERRRNQDRMRTKNTPRRPAVDDPHVARRVVSGKRPNPETSTSDSSRSRKKQTPAPSPLEFTIEIQKKATSKPSPVPSECYRTDQSVITAKGLAKLAKTYGFTHATTICAQERQRAEKPGDGWCAWSRYHIQAGGSLPLHPYFVGIANYFGISPFQITPNGIQALSALYVLYFFRKWKPPTPHEVHFLFDLKTNPGQKNSGFFHLFHRHKGTQYLHGIAHKSYPGKYFEEYFMTSDIHSTYTAFRHAGPFIQPLPTKAMKTRAGILASLPYTEKDVKTLTSTDNLRVAGLYLTEHPSSRSESSYEDIDPLDEVSSPVGPVVCPRVPWLSGSRLWLRLL